MSLSILGYRARLLAIRDLILASSGGAAWYMSGTIADFPEDAPVSSPLAILPLTIAEFTMHPTDAAMAIFKVGNAASSGVVTWLRFVDGLGDAVLDLTAGPPGSGAQAILTDEKEPPTTRVWTGGEVTLNLTLTDP